MNRNFKFEEDPFYKKAQGVSKIYHDVLFLRKFLQTKPQVNNEKVSYFDI